MLNSSTIEIYCDGACSGNPGPGGWGAVLLYQDNVKELSGYNATTTNNRMELTAAIEALKAVRWSLDIKIYTDSIYVKEGITNWLKSWKRNNWKNGKVKNIDLWQELDEVSSRFSIEWLWVKGHSGNKYNERADKLAVGQVKANR